MSNISYIYAALILHENGKEITPENIVGILKAAGVTNIDEGFAAAVANSLSKVNIEEIKSKALVMPAAVAAPAAPVEEKKEEKPAKEEKKEEKEKKEEEEEAVSGLAALFG